MARNSEKAMTALSRWRQLQGGEDKRDERRPFNPQDCNELQKALKFRRQVVSEISKKIATIQNPGLGEFKLRDLNDEINKQLREKMRWEFRIRELGGPDYLKMGARMDRDGRELPGHRGYKYFGAAKDLPGVRELFEPPPSASSQKQTRGELLRRIDARYFGFLDDELIDESVERQLAEAEKRIMAKRVIEWHDGAAHAKAAESAKRARTDAQFEYGGTLNQRSTTAASSSATSRAEDAAVGVKATAIDSEFDSLLHASASESGAMMVVNVPSQKDVEEAIVRRKKIELLDRYCSDALINDEQNTRSLLGL